MEDMSAITYSNPNPVAPTVVYANAREVSWCTRSHLHQSSTLQRPQDEAISHSLNAREWRKHPKVTSSTKEKNAANKYLPRQLGGL